jgi:preprotein translocase subunit SecA
MSIFSKALRIGEGKRLKELEVLVERVNALEPEIELLSDGDLVAKTAEFRNRIRNGESVDDLEDEAYAVVREAAKRTLGQRPFDVQIIGAGTLHRGMISEMRTGEGKTLVSTMPAYLNALAGKGVHIITVNDYLAARDSEWMGQIHRFLGLEVGLIQADMTPQERKPAYDADITYGTNNEFGFDYLRDNMTMRPEDRTQRGHYYGIVDEVDSILIDEARTPLIISGRVGETGKWYRDFARIVERLRRDEHYEVDEKKRQVIVTEIGVTQVEQILGVENMYDFANVDFIHHLDVALKAKGLYHRDVDYLIKNGEIMIVDEFTGRVLEGRRYSEGLHQAIEAKEGVHIKEENQTLATITLQNYFRMYEKLAGMTGTALTEAGEFHGIYGLEVLDVPTNQPIARLDQADVVYLDEDHKFAALADDIEERSRRGQPVLVGTISIEKSERLANTLKRRGIRHEVLNAKQHEREGHIIAQAGQLGSVTVATNMAGRGVDIQLGGNPEELARSEMIRKEIPRDDPTYEATLAASIERFRAETEQQRQQVLDAGGLYVLGTERHDSRRIDNQLRGRSGRQGDPGESRFEHKMVTKAIERAQTQVESQNFEIRKNVLKYDEVMNTQRQIIYTWRNQILDGEDTDVLLSGWRTEVVEFEVETMTAGVDASEWDWADFDVRMKAIYEPTIGASAFSDPELLTADEIVDAYVADADTVYTAREAQFGANVMRQLERTVTLSVIDNKWREHLAEMDYLRSGIGLRAMGQKDPLVEYQREGFNYFEELVDAVKHDSIRYMFHVDVVQKQEAPRGQVTTSSAKSVQQIKKKQFVRTGEKVGRNAPCPCGSGKKYKRCHGAVGAEPLA